MTIIKVLYQRSDDDQLVPGTNHPMPGAHRRRSSRRKLFNILRREGNAGRIFPTFDYSNEFCDNFNLAGGPGSESEEELRWKS